MPFGTKLLRFTISPERVTIDFFAELVHRFGFFLPQIPRDKCAVFAKQKIQFGGVCIANMTPNGGNPTLSNARRGLYQAPCGFGNAETELNGDEHCPFST